MNRNFSLHNLLLCILIILASVLLYRSCNDHGQSKDSIVLSQDAYNDLNHRIDSLTVAANDRKPLIQVSHDSTIYLTTEVINTATYYKTITDTILKLKACDSLANQAIDLARQARYNDSLHLAQEKDLEAIIAGKDTIITVINTENKKLRKKFRIAVGAGTAAVAVTVVTIYRNIARHN